MTYQIEDLRQERRHRLAAQANLKTESTRARESRARLEVLTKRLTGQVIEKREELEALRAAVAGLKQERDALDRRLADIASNAKADERSLWAALQALRDGFALFDKEHRLVVANTAYLSPFDGLAEIERGISYRRLCDLLIEEGAIDPGPEGDGWTERMIARLRMRTIPDETLHFWNGRNYSLSERHLPNGGIVSMVVNQTEAIHIREAIEAIPDGFAIYDRDDRLVICNAPYRQMYDRSADAIRPGIRFEDLLRHGLERGQYAESAGREEAWLADRMRRHLNPDDAPLEIQLGNGRWIQVLERRTSDGSIVGLRVDVTALKRQQAELERMHHLAAAATRAKSAFLANMSHEIRTPANGVVGMATLLMDEDLTERQHEMIDTLRSSSEALLVLLDDILDFSAIEAGAISIDARTFDLSDVVESVLASFRATCWKKGLNLALDRDRDVPGLLRGDPRRLRQILTNLVGNAVRFTEAGSVTLSIRRDGGRTVIEVEDTGPGVPPDRADRVFDGAVQEGEGFGSGLGGRGLGLAVCRRLVDLMGGDIWYAPRPGGGARFGLSLQLDPVTQAVPPAVAAQPAPSARATPGPDRATALRSAATARSAPAPDLARIGAEPARAVSGAIRVLAAEDNAVNRMVLEKLLEPSGVALTMVETGTEALAAITADAPDLVLTDISMPDMDGTELTRRLRAWEAETGRAPLRIVAMTAHAMQDDIDAILAAGLDHVLTKPLKRELLERQIAAVRPL
ncbi:PAS-domain containing protein [Palleronia rufa]|uniref:PAS-domain containing protein n=1 Tax=Palleronia rufa TaxID=1530186 RepID=UPI00068E5C9D|nr:PAS-domain containing protein [Palleronia rufa]